MKLKLDPTNYDACPQYNDWLDEQYVDQSGELNILGYRPRPSLVLYRLSIDTYEAAFADFQTEWQESLKRAVFDEFPAPIAHYFYRFENGYENDLQRLHFLRDTWESIVDILHALAVAECRFQQIALADPITFRHFLSDSVAERLLSIERILNLASGLGINLAIGNIVSVPVLESMRELNRSRNAFSHSAAQSETQARNWISECYEDVMDILDELRPLENVVVVRYRGQVNFNTLRVEVFRGHGFTRTIQDFSLTTDQVQDSQRFFQQDEILASCSSSIFSLRPLIYFREDTSGHVTKLCMFRRTHGEAPDRHIEYEIVGESTRWNADRTLFQAELNEIRALFGLSPE